MNLNTDFQDYLLLLNKYDVQYLLVGGMAVNMYGYRRSTGDMDLFINPTAENHEKLKKVHSEFGMHMGEMERLENFLNTDTYDVYTFGVSPIQIDIMTKCKGLDFEGAFSNRDQLTISRGLVISIVDLHDLMSAKQASGRHRDLADIEELKKIHKI
ncbi:MAG: hypothetical protein JXQ90_12330 [Cyclobacteriaceae bacterium]